MGLILDTNALSAIVEGDPGAAQKVEAATEIAIPVVVLGEYRYGISRSRHRREYERWITQMLSISQILNIDEESAVSYAELRSQLKEAGTPIPSNDIWIAALCRQHHFPILSQDRHFDLVRDLTRLGW